MAAQKVGLVLDPVKGLSEGMQCAVRNTIVHTRILHNTFTVRLGLCHIRPKWTLGRWCAPHQAVVHPSSATLPPFLLPSARFP